MVPHDGTSSQRQDTGAAGVGVGVCARVNVDVIADTPLGGADAEPILSRTLSHLLCG